MQQEGTFNEFQSINMILPDESIYHFDQEEHNQLLDDRPWNNDPEYFKICKISVNALIKMLIHSCLGKNNEVMGIMQGRIEKESFIIYDVIQLHAQASETTVKLTEQSNADMTETMDYLEKVGRVHPAVGWYHSHPSYGCWLSGTDVATQEQQQLGYGAFVAVVIDPIRTITNQKVDIGAFRVYPQNYKKPEGITQLQKTQDQNDQQSQIIPQNKIKDFGAHHSRYYSLDVQYYSNSMDATILQDLWKQYWGVRLAQSAFWGHEQYFQNGMRDLKDKCYRHKADAGQKSSSQSQGEQKQIVTAIDPYTKTVTSFTIEYAQAILRESLKGMIFQQ